MPLSTSVPTNRTKIELLQTKNLSSLPKWQRTFLAYMSNYLPNPEDINRSQETFLDDLYQEHCTIH